MSDAKVRFKRLYIEQIFGPGSHDIDIAFRLDERVTVLHGRNGSGKTITLRILEALKAKTFDRILIYPFKRLRLEMTNDEEIEIVPQTTIHGKGLRYRLTGQDGEEETGSLTRSSRIRAREQSRDVLSHLGFDLTANDLYRERHTGRALTLSEVEHQYEPQLRRLKYEPTRSIKGKNIGRFLLSLPPVRLIDTDRLHHWESGMGGMFEAFEPDRRLLMVEHLGAQVRELVQAADASYRQISTDLDGSLARRLFEQQPEHVSPELLQARSAHLRAQEQHLIALGLLHESTSTVDESRLSEAQLGTFSIILADREQKLAPFASVAAKAERLLLSLNRKLAPKRIRLDVEKGYRVDSAAGTELPLSCLSSGEQQELVLLHSLLFDVTPGSLILIDEPELSLHVTWQEDMIPDLLEIARLSDIDFVLATHSPFIIGDGPGRAELMVRLGDPP